jgi:hypothetical protein
MYLREKVFKERILVGHAWRHFLWLKAMAIYLVKQACGNEILFFISVRPVGTWIMLVHIF